MRRILFATALLTLAAPALAQAPAGGSPQTFEAPIVGAQGQRIGALSLRGTPNAVVGRVEIQAGGLPPGWHGLHFHKVGDCSDTGKFQISGGHVNHDESNKHGFLNPDGPEAGDLPNLFAQADGSAQMEFATVLVTLDGEEDLIDSDGSALVIHASPDDHTTQPIGGAGARVACAVIK